MTQTRYELLRINDVVYPEMSSQSVGGAILRSLRDARAIATSYQSFIPPDWNSISNDALTIAWGKAGSYPSGDERNMYLVERVRIEPRYIVRAMYLDNDGLPLKSDYIPVGYNLTLSEAMARKRALEEDPNLRMFFIDIFPQDL